MKTETFSKPQNSVKVLPRAAAGGRGGKRTVVVAHYKSISNRKMWYFYIHILENLSNKPLKSIPAITFIA